MSEFSLKIVTPAGVVFDNSVTSVRVPGSEGSFGILNRHMPLIAMLEKGLVRVKEEKGLSFFAIDPGIVEIDKNHHVLILSDYVTGAATLEEGKDLLKKSLNS